MAERYSKQFEFANAVYSSACPVALEKGAVLLDTKTNTYKLQLKFSNIGTARIVAVQIYVEAVDSAGNDAYQGVSHTYEEFAAIGETFGTKKLLPLPNNNAVTFRVYVEQIKAAYGNTQTFTREQYIANDGQQDMEALREKAVKADIDKQREKQEKQERIISMWGKKWYHAVFALCLVHILFLYLMLPRLNLPSLILLLLILCIHLFAWSSIGKPSILKRCSIAAFLGSLISLARILILVEKYGSSIGYMMALMVFIFLSYLPFLGIYFNARIYDASLDFKQSLMFWVKPKRINAAGK
jgi:hypothetical protein